MKGNPVVALTRVPGLMSGLGNISGSLGKSIPAFNALSESMPDAISLARTASEAVMCVQQAQSALSGVDKRPDSPFSASEYHPYPDTTYPASDHRYRPAPPRWYRTHF